MPDDDDKPAPDERLFTLASWIDEGREVDWDEAARAARTEEERAIVEELRLLAGVARVCRDPDSAIPADVRATLEALESGAVSPRRSSTAAPADFARWGGLTLLEPIGRGSFATVYRARDDNLQREVALKLFAPAIARGRAGAPAGFAAAGTPERIARTRREGELLARVKHQNIVTIHGADEHDGRPGLWMEFIHGRTLEAELATRGTFSAQEAALLGRDLCRALAAVHGAQLLHRDVKAHNVMRETGGRIVLMDFGSGIDAGPQVRGTARDIAGTPLYLAPELFAGAAATRASDIYSLGVLLFHLVTGEYPVDGANRSEIEAAHAQHRRRRLRDARPDLPDAFVQVIERAIAPAADQRFRTAGELDDALARACGLPTHLPTPSSSAGASLAETIERDATPPSSPRLGSQPAPWEDPRKEARSEPDRSRATAAPLRDRAPHGTGRAAWLTAWLPPWLPAWLAERPAAAWVVAGIMIAAIAFITWPMFATRANVGGSLDTPASPSVQAAGSQATSSPASSSQPPLPPAGSYAVKATLYRQVNDEQIVLRSGDRIAPGDDIGMRLWSTQPLYTYVVNRDERGEAYLLFPIKGYEQQNPLAPGEHQLPGGREGADQFWEVTSRGGEEHFLVFADTSPMPEFDELLRKLPAPEPGRPVRYAAVPSALVGTLRGVGGIAPARHGRSTRMNALFASARPLARDAETVSGPWLRLITFKNPVE